MNNFVERDEKKKRGSTVNKVAEGIMTALVRYSPSPHACHAKL